MKRLDIRVPMGTMFTMLGAILTVYGVFSAGSPAYARSLDINVNLWWGAVILVFGVALLALAWHHGRQPIAGTVPPAEPPHGVAT